MNSTLTFDGIPCNITNLKLENGELIIWAKSQHWHTGTIDTDAEATIYDPNGNLVAHIPSVAKGNHPNKIRDSYINVRLPININNIAARTTADGHNIAFTKETP